MKKFTRTNIIALALVLGTTTLFASSDDYALTENYKLLNDMKLAQKQQALIVSMGQTLESERLDVKALKDAQIRFEQILTGLDEGNSAIKLKGTSIPKIKAKLKEVKNLWNAEVKRLNGSLMSSDEREDAIDGLNKIMVKMSQAVEIYNNSYSRFKQRSKLSSIVNRHINARKNQTFALNIVK